MGEWANASIGDFFDLEPGYAFKSRDFIDAGIPVIKIKNIKAGRFSEREFSYVSSKFLSPRANKLARPGDLLISMSGNRHDGSPETWVGKVAPFNANGEYFINQRVGALRRKTIARIDLRFASFLLSSLPYQNLFISIATRVKTH
jgi:type I restriction enzyme S subunit